MPNTGKTQRTIIWAVVALFGITILAVVLLALFYEGDVSPLVTAVLSAATPTIAVLAAMRSIEQVRADTHALTNGLLDSKVRGAVAETVRDELVDPSYVASGQHAADQVAIDHAHNGGNGA